MTSEINQVPPDVRQSEKQAELQTMKFRLERILCDPELRKVATADFVHTFKQLGLLPERADELCQQVCATLLQPRALVEIEMEILQMFEAIKIGEQTLVEILHEKLRDRASIIATQVAPYLRGLKGKVLDYGAGDGQVTQLLHDREQIDIEGVDVRDYKASGVTVPISVFDGKQVVAADGAYEAAVLTNVLHHEKENERILAELDRLVAKRLVILETVPVGATTGEMESDKDRTFMNDYLYNRLFHNADVPVPGTFETPQGWIKKFGEHGWQVTHQEDLGFDQPTIKDRHYLLVFER